MIAFSAFFYCPPSGKIFPRFIFRRIYRLKIILYIIVAREKRKTEKKKIFQKELKNAAIRVIMNTEGVKKNGTPIVSEEQNNEEKNYRCIFKFHRRGDSMVYLPRRFAVVF